MNTNLFRHYNNRYLSQEWGHCYRSNQLLSWIPLILGWKFMAVIMDRLVIMYMTQIHQHLFSNHSPCYLIALLEIWCLYSCIWVDVVTHSAQLGRSTALWFLKHQSQLALQLPLTLVAWGHHFSLGSLTGILEKHQLTSGTKCWAFERWYLKSHSSASKRSTEKTHPADHRPNDPHSHVQTKLMLFEVHSE